MSLPSSLPTRDDAPAPRIVPDLAPRSGRSGAAQPTVPEDPSLASFLDQGFAVFEDLLDLELLRDLQQAYGEALEAKIRRFALRPAEVDGDPGDAVLNDFKPAGGNHDTNRWNMHLPSRLPFLAERIFANPRVMEIVRSVIGEDCVVYLLASDTPFPGATNQGLHQDFTRLSLALNIPLVDLHESNGPIEIWPKTHGPGGVFTADPWRIDAAEMRRIADTVPGRKMQLRAGSGLLRDHRLVHRGTANSADDPRPMLSIYYVPAHAVPHRFLADLGAWAALRLRRIGKGRGGVVRHQGLLNLGNLLGRIAEESSLSDRDYRRVLSAELVAGLSPEARRLLRFARHERSSARSRGAAGSLGGSLRYLGLVGRSLWTFTASSLLRTPRKPD